MIKINDHHQHLQVVFYYQTGPTGKFASFSAFKIYYNAMY